MHFDSDAGLFEADSGLMLPRLLLDPNVIRSEFYFKGIMLTNFQTAHTINVSQIEDPLFLNYLCL